MAGLISTAMGDTTKDTELGQDVFKATTTGFDPATRTVDPSKETVAGQLNTDLATESPLITRARNSATQAANRRGLINSSIAAGAGEAAAIDAALPIASADANTYTTAARDNQNMQNAALQFGAGAANTTSQVNAGAGNQVATMGYGNELQKGIIGAQTAAQSQLQTQAGQQASQLSAQQAQQETALQGVRGAQATSLAQIEADYKGLIQASASASRLFDTAQQSIAAIMSDTNTSVQQKQDAVNTATALLRAGLTIEGAVANVDLAGLLDFNA